MATRTHAREAVVGLIYAYLSGNSDIQESAEYILHTKKIRNTQATFALALFDGVIEHIEEIDNIIKNYLKSWELGKLGVIDRSILQLGVYEILYSDIDTPIIINEAIEVAKILGSENTPRFVNGILDAIGKNRQSLLEAR